MAELANPLMGHLDRQLEMNSSAGMLYDVFGNRCDLFRRLTRPVINDVEDVWSLTFVEDNCGTWKFRVESDDETRFVTWTLLEGEVPQTLYSTLRVECQFSGNDQSCKAKVKLTYVKTNITVQVPVRYMDVICNLIVEVANHTPTR